HHREVAEGDPPVEQSPDARPGEHGLHHHRHIDHDDEIDAGEREHWDQGVLERVLADDEGLRQARDAGGADVRGGPERRPRGASVGRMWAGAKYQPSAKAGMTRCAAVPEPDDGSHPRYTEKNKISTRPTQNEGSESPSNANTLPALSQKRPTRTAARMPLGMPIRREKAMAAVARSSELGRRDR